MPLGSSYLANTSRARSTWRMIQGTDRYASTGYSDMQPPHVKSKIPSATRDWQGDSVNHKNSLRIRSSYLACYRFNKAACAEYLGILEQSIVYVVELFNHERDNERRVGLLHSTKDPGLARPRRLPRKRHSVEESNTASDRRRRRRRRSATNGKVNKRYQSRYASTHYQWIEYGRIFFVLFL